MNLIIIKYTHTTHLPVYTPAILIKKQYMLFIFFKYICHYVLLYSVRGLIWNTYHVPCRQDRQADRHRQTGRQMTDWLNEWMDERSPSWQTDRQTNKTGKERVKSREWEESLQCTQRGPHDKKHSWVSLHKVCFASSLARPGTGHAAPPYLAHAPPRLTHRKAAPLLFFIPTYFPPPLLPLKGFLSPDGIREPTPSGPEEEEEAV